MQDANFGADVRNRVEMRALEEKTFALDLLKAAPGLETLMDSDYFSFDRWDSPDGMGFMGELLRTCDRVVDQEIGKLILPPVFAYLEARAEELDSHVSKPKGIFNPRLDAIDSLLFTFTDNPTGKDLTLRKLASFMGPKIAAMCTFIE